MTQEINLDHISEEVLESIRREDLELELERTKWRRYWVTIKQHWPIYVMLIPVVLFFYFFRYRPIGEILIGFKFDEGNAALTTNQLQFIGLDSFRILMFGNRMVQFWRAFRNTFTISMYGLIFGFPMPIILALLFSEIKNEGYRAITQIITYLPKFISTVVITSIVALMFNGGDGNTVQPGILHSLLTNIGWLNQGDKASTLSALRQSQYFRSIFIITDIWEGAGYGSIVYFAAIMAISPTNYEAAKMDGASKLEQIRYVTLPGMAPTLTIMLILRIGSVLTVGYEKIMLLTENQGVEVLNNAEVISTYVLSLGGLLSDQQGAANGNSLAAAADLFNSFIAMILVLGANFISRRVSNTSLF